MYYVVKKHFSIEHSQIFHNSCFYCPWFKDNGEIERMKIVHLFLVQSLEHLCEEQVNDVCKEDIRVTMKILHTLPWFYMFLLTETFHTIFITLDY